SDDIETWQSLVKKHRLDSDYRITKGGSTRFQSVKNGLALIKASKGLVAIHDGVRPLIDVNTIAASFSIAAVHQSAVAAVRLKESIRKTDQDQTKAVDRSHYRLIQTPQTFSIELIKKAYEITEESSLTDDASVAERAGHKISLFEGSYTNIKITTPEDMIIAEALLKGMK
ncbi:MAG: 2-C-methyl-D-erythritol 4-phosphate cytidylyltransferase, partial [Fulvivirga sp.]|nr:2-C-methyl-D-erythritol 4-phosphate cytidylyltransferase [Fulvivirga sp.]